MRALVDIPDTQIDALAELCDAQGISRAEAIRRAIAIYLDQNTQVPVDAFGLWASPQDQTKVAENRDGLDYQEKLRGEW